MAKKNSKKEQATETVTNNPITPIVSNMVELTANNGSLNKYGKRNLIAHGRHAQGGQIDQQAFKSFLTGKPVTFADCVTQNINEAVSNPLTPSRIDAHLQHLVGKHGFKVLIDPIKKMFQVTGVGSLDKEQVKAACDIL